MSLRLSPSTQILAAMHAEALARETAPPPAPSRSRVLLVEDSARLAASIRDYLERHGYEVFIEGDGARRGRALRPPQARPGDPGPDAARARTASPSAASCAAATALPILILTAKGENIDQVLGLEMGADDYVVKPVEPRVLLARIEALLRRARSRAARGARGRRSPPAASPSTARAAPPRIDGRAVELTTGDFDILWLLASRQGNVVTRDEILRVVRGIDYDGLDRSIDARICRLRRKLAGRGRRRVHDQDGSPARVSLRRRRLTGRRDAPPLPAAVPLPHAAGDGGVRVLHVRDRPGHGADARRAAARARGRGLRPRRAHHHRHARARLAGAPEGDREDLPRRARDRAAATSALDDFFMSASEKERLRAGDIAFRDRPGGGNVYLRRIKDSDRALRIEWVGAYEYLLLYYAIILALVTLGDVRDPLALDAAAVARPRGAQGRDRARGRRATSACARDGRAQLAAAARSPTAFNVMAERVQRAAAIAPRPRAGRGARAAHAARAAQVRPRARAHQRRAERARASASTRWSATWSTSRSW